jgi:hypothetical protein
MTKADGIVRDRWPAVVGLVLTGERKVPVPDGSLRVVGDELVFTSRVAITEVAGIMFGLEQLQAHLADQELLEQYGRKP